MLHHRFREYILPNQIRKYDGLNAVYNIINVMKFMINVGEKKYLDELCFELFERIGPWPNVMWEGLRNEDVHALLTYAVHRFNTMDIEKRSIRRLEVERYPLPVTNGYRLFSGLRKTINWKNECLLMRTQVPWDNWPFCGFVGMYKTTEFRIYMSDVYKAEKHTVSSLYTSDINTVDPFAVKPKRYIDPQWCFLVRRIDA